MNKENEMPKPYYPSASDMMCRYIDIITEQGKDIKALLRWKEKAIPFLEERKYIYQKDIDSIDDLPYTAVNREDMKESMKRMLVELCGLIYE